MTWKLERTEELLGGAALLDNLNEAGLQLLNRGDVVGENTHLTGLGRNVDLDDILGLVDGLYAAISYQLPLTIICTPRARISTLGSIGSNCFVDSEDDSCHTWWGSDKLSLICSWG